MNILLCPLHPTDMQFVRSLLTKQRIPFASSAVIPPAAFAQPLLLVEPPEDNDWRAAMITLRQHASTALVPIIGIGSESASLNLPIDAWLPPDVSGGEFQRCIDAMSRLSTRLRDDCAEDKQQRGQLQLSVDRLNELMAVVAHDLKNPMASIKGYADMMLRRAKKNPDDANTKGLTIISQQVVRMNRMVNQFHEFARIGAGRMEIAPEVQNIVDVARGLIDEVQPVTPNHRLEFEATQPDIMVRVDRLRIQQALNNVVGNAVAYSPDGSVVRIQVHRNNGAPMATITISDQGIGISSEDAEHIFEPFYRGSEAQKRARGSGIGLYITKEIMQSHGGSISVESERGHGSTVTLALPTMELPEDLL